MGYRISAEEAQAFERDGYLFVENFLPPEELGYVLDAVRGDGSVSAHATDRHDSQGKISRLALWNHPSNDIFGMIARSEKMVGTMETLLGGEVYHYHSKVMMKEPRVGGAWEWHQDYGYWYMNGCLYPYMASCMIALDEATKENGCLQVLKGSHHMGRIEHGTTADQVGADLERVEEAKKRMDLVHCEMKPGTALFFHSNLLHCSAANESDKPRWVLICCYNAARNNPYKESGHPRYTPLTKAPDEAIIEAGKKGALDLERDWMGNAKQEAALREGR